MRMKTTLLAACVAAVSWAGIAAAQDTLKIGHIAPRSGPLKGPGEPSIAAVDIAVEEINAAGGVNGKMIEIVRFDSASDPNRA